MKQSDDLNGIWQARIEAWIESGCSMARWCRDHQIRYDQFIYWKNKLGTKDHKHKKVVSPCFVELVDSPSDPGIVLECGGVQIQLAAHFDETALQRCIHILRRVV
ncbi:hypothetical protein SCG7086_AA_00680 [Chlamydiales bacterium SCGC AG-110-P3]|nr:hypothetical protein SCG7086_AA_00680 [Chlamydiales bacterium SCGC AG-110-P3]